MAHDVVLRGTKTYVLHVPANPWAVGPLGSTCAYDARSSESLGRGSELTFAQGSLLGDRV